MSGGSKKKKGGVLGFVEDTVKNTTDFATSLAKDTIANPITNPIGAATINAVGNISDPRTLLSDMGAMTKSASDEVTQEAIAALEIDFGGMDEETKREIEEMSRLGQVDAIKSVLDKYELGEGIYGLRKKALTASKDTKKSILTANYMAPLSGEGGSVMTRG